MVVLHGYGANNDPGRFGMNAAADRHGFAVCYPQGAKDGRGKTCWNVGYPFQADMAIDDVEFITQLVRHLQKKHGLSRRNVFCTGMSNGGEMCYQLAAQRPRLFAAVAPVSGLMLEWLYKADTSDVPVPLFEIHGTADRTSAWEGDLDNKGGWGAYVAVPMAVHYWAAKNKCTGMQTDTIPGARRKTAARSSPTASRAARAAAKSGSTRSSAGNIRGANRTSTRARSSGNFSASS